MAEFFLELPLAGSLEAPQEWLVIFIGSEVFIHQEGLW